jgi:6-phosphofructokinase 1
MAPKTIAVLTSGGDAPGMNAAIRAVTRAALYQGWQVYGVRHGYTGLIEGQFLQFTARSVGGIIQQGGTMLGSARCAEFMTDEGRRKALRQMAQHGVEGLVVIGGNGSQTGAFHLAEMGFPVVGVASTIDNDLVGSDLTIGVDTALNVALEAIDRLKITASSHERAFLVEVMGRKCGYLALMAGIAGGAEIVIIPEIETAPEQVAEELGRAYDLGKAHALGVVAEGARHDVRSLAAYFKEHQARIGFDVRVTTLGHVQRGGAPTAYDRILASRLGAGAVATLARGETGVVVGVIRNQLASTPLSEVVGKQKPISPELFELARVMNL